MSIKEQQLDELDSDAGASNVSYVFVNNSEGVTLIWMSALITHNCLRLHQTRPQQSVSAGLQPRRDHPSTERESFMRDGEFAFGGPLQK